MTPLLFNTTATQKFKKKIKNKSDHSKRLVALQSFQAWFEDSQALSRIINLERMDRTGEESIFNELTYMIKRVYTILKNIVDFYSIYHLSYHRNLRAKRKMLFSSRTTSWLRVLMKRRALFWTISPASGPGSSCKLPARNSQVTQTRCTLIMLGDCAQFPCDAFTSGR